MSYIRKADYLKKVFAAKKQRRKALARLSYAEKLKIWLDLKNFSRVWRTR
jgi:hypothetical protein